MAGLGGLGVLLAIRRQRRLELSLMAAAETDPLTGLLNRYGLDNQISKYLKTPGMGGHAVLLLDLDRFKAINDAHGHLAGDAVLREVARRCRDLLRSPKTTLTRLGGDELLITLHGLPQPVETARNLANRIQEALRQPLLTSAGELSIGSSIGIATADGLTDLSDLLTEADIALRDAKSSGRGGISCFDKPQHREIAQGLSTGQDIRVTCHYQPQIDLRTGQVIGLEALARWTRKDGTLLVAKEWIRIVEQLGQTRRLLAQVVSATATASRELGDSYKGRFWINFSPADLTGSRPAEAFLETLEAHDLDPRRVGIEIIETAHDFDPQRSATVLNTLREAGVLTSIDDFGIGYTPIGHLTSLPLDRVKIDRSVTRDLATNPQSQALARALADICRFLDLELLAEGIETKDELRTLLRLGVRYSQSYLLGRPMPVDELRVWLTEPLCSLGSIDTLPSQVLPRSFSVN